MYVIQHERLCVHACVCARRDLRCIPVMPKPSSSVSFPSVFKERNLIKDKEDKMCYKQEHMHVCTNNLNNFESFGIDNVTSYFWSHFCYTHVTGNNKDLALIRFFMFLLR